MLRRFPRGSEWRVWDLHVHTPASFQWNGKRFKEMTYSEKDVEIERILNHINKLDPAVFCIMDYWTFDGYLDITDFIHRKTYPIGKTIFPGMEMRIEAPVNYRLNIHVILSNTLSKQCLMDFRSCLKIRNYHHNGKERPISDESIIEFAQTLDVSKARYHGFNDPKSLSQDELLRLGAITIEITKSSLLDGLRALPCNSGYILMPYDTSDGLKKLDWASHPHADNYFMQSAHVFESRDCETVDLFLNNRNTVNEKYIDNFQKTLGKPKPVICGSDAHKLDDYGIFPGQRKTWIKADPTFEGLKQIIYEPSERVKIQTENPQDKYSYLLIDKVRFVDNSRRLFPTEWIEINPDYNTIIGGKSSGKSLLLYYIAKTISPINVEKLNKYVTEYSFATLSDFEVLWQDGHVDKLSQIDNKKRDVTYIPQMFINKMAEQEGKKELISLIESTLEQSDTYKNFIHLMKERITSTENDIVVAINNVTTLRRQHHDCQQELRSMGDRSAIENDIAQSKLKIDELNKASGFSIEDEINYRNKNNRIDWLRTKCLRYKQYRELFVQFKEHIDTAENTITSQMNNFIEMRANDKWQQRSIQRFFHPLENDIHSVFARNNNKTDEIINNINAKISGLDKDIAATLALLRPYEDKVKNKELLVKLSKSVDDQSKILLQINMKTEQIVKIKERGLHAREQLFSCYAVLFKHYQDICAELSKDDYKNIGSNIELTASAFFNAADFSNFVLSLIDRRANLKSCFGNYFDSNNDYIYNVNEHHASIKDIYEKISSVNKDKSSIRIKNNITDGDILSSLFKNHFSIQYKIKYNGEDILNMSPGKRGLVLLQMIIHISNSVNPILIDQPEDNLDNRTIYSELREFIKKKKVKRQFLVVTHNANLVVANDAENIIVSNQSGQQTGKENREYQFEYVSGSLENSFKDADKQFVLERFGIREHVCDVLEGGEDAFRKREDKYGFS